MIVKGPGIEPGSRSVGNMYLLDLMATFCDLTGVPAPATSEGRSLRPVLEGRQSTVRDTLYGVYSGGQKPGIRSVRHGDWKLIKYDVPRAGVQQTQLFNLAENPHELLKEHHTAELTNLVGDTPAPHQVNLADDPEHADKLAEMEALLLAEMRRWDDPYRLWDQPQEEATIAQKKRSPK